MQNCIYNTSNVTSSKFDGFQIIPTQSELFIKVRRTKAPKLSFMPYNSYAFFQESRYSKI